MNFNKQTTNSSFPKFLDRFSLFCLFLTILFITSCNSNNEENSLYENNPISEATTKRDAGESCFSTEDVDLTNCFFVGQNIAVTLDDYPGCTFTIELSYYRCTGLNQIDKWFYIENVRLINHNCPDFDNDVLLAQQNGTLAEFTLGIDVMLFVAAKDYLGSNIFQFATFTYNYLTASCNQYCWITGNKNGFTYLTYFRIPCGEGCCAIESVYSYDSNGDIISQTTDVTSDAVSQGCNENNSCGGPGVVFSSRCIFTCDAYL